MTPDEIKRRIEECAREANDTLAPIVAPLQKLSALQARIELLNELLNEVAPQEPMLPKDSPPEPPVRGPNGQ